MSGNPLGSNYNFDDARINAWWIRDYSLSYARELPTDFQSIFSSLAAGVTIKYVQGFAFAQSMQTTGNSITTNSANDDITLSTNYSIQSAFSDNFNVKYNYANSPNDSTNSNNNNSNVGPFPTPAGTGMGFDLGLNGSIGDTWKFALAITDIGSINWDKMLPLLLLPGNIHLLI